VRKLCSRPSTSSAPTAELWSERRKSLQRRWPAIAVPVLHGFVLMLPILLGDMLYPSDARFSSSIWVTLFAIELVLYAVGTVFVIFMLFSERAVTKHKNAASVDPLTGTLNHGALVSSLADAIERARRDGETIGVALVDNALVVPATSVSVAASLCVPSASRPVVKVQAPALFPVVVPMTVVPSSILTVLFGSARPLSVRWFTLVMFSPATLL